MSDASSSAPVTPEVAVALPEVPEGWRAAVPTFDDLPEMIALRGADQQPWTGSRRLDDPLVESEVVGPGSWTRRQAILRDPEGVLRAWATAHDRARGRTMLHVYVDRSLAEPRQDEVAAACYAWVEARGLDIARLHRLPGTRLDASPFADDLRQREWLAAAGYTRRRVWLHLDRPVDPVADSASALPPPRPGVRVRRVAGHDNGMPLAADLQVVHQMLEESFQDHFNSYRESFPEFVQRLREDPSHRWDHWWLAFVDPDPEQAGDGGPKPAGTVVCSVLAEDAGGHAGTYVEYIGVNRHARGRGVAKALLHTVIADAAARGRNRVGLEVDADSPTGADGLYRSMGWVQDFVTESWFREITV